MYQLKKPSYGCGCDLGQVIQAHWSCVHLRIIPAQPIYLSRFRKGTCTREVWKWETTVCLFGMVCDRIRLLFSTMHGGCEKSGSHNLTVKESLMCSSNCTLPGVGSRYSNALDQGWVLATCISSIQFSKRLLTCILCIYSTAQDAINVSMSKRRSSAP